MEFGTPKTPTAELSPFEKLARALPGQLQEEFRYLSRRIDTLTNTGSGESDEPEEMLLPDEEDELKELELRYEELRKIALEKLNEK